jgi:uncharacterized membrane protein YiaA
VNYIVARMSQRATTWIAWSVWAMSVMLFAFTWLLNILIPPLPWLEETPLLNVLYAVLVLTYQTVGALVASRRPENPIGWIFLGTGLVANAFQGFALTYANYSLWVRDGSMPGTEYMAWFSYWIALPFVALATVSLLLLFPTGSLPSRKWRVVVWMAVCGTAMLCLWDASIPGPLTTHRSIDNPVAIGGDVGNAIELVGKGGMFFVLVSILFAVVSLIKRLVLARGDERQQLKWFTLAAGLMLVGFLGAVLLAQRPLLNEIGWSLGMFGFFFFPVAVGISILRYKLYEIDLIINRTLVYGALTATLVALYFGGIVLLQTVLVGLTGQKSSFAVVASTLVIAALFNPLRRRIQSFIDRRFYRRKYNARKTLESFSVKLRDETDLDTLSGDLVGVVRETMQPAHVSLWLRTDHIGDGSRYDRQVADGGDGNRDDANR